MLTTLLILVVSQTSIPKWDLAAPSWAQINKLAEEQKNQEAVTALEQRLELNKASVDFEDRARILVKLTGLRQSLGAAETAVEKLRQEPWPTAQPYKALIEIFYADAVLSYLSQYRWEIDRREKIDTSNAVELKKLSTTQLRAEANAKFDLIWQDRAALGATPSKNLPDFIVPNTYPSGMRDSLRDALTYAIVDRINLSGDWSAEERNGLFALDFAALLKGDEAPSKTSPLADDGRHPLLRVSALLADLEKWNLSKGNAEGALGTRVQRARILAQHFSSAEQRAAIIADLQKRTDAAAALPFSAFARGEIAELYQRVGKLALARDAAAIGAKTFPDSIGGKHCATLVQQLEAPYFDLSASQNDGLGKPSVLVNARNLKTLHFRAWRMSLDDLMRNGARLAISNDEKALKKLMAHPADAEWSTELPATPDLQVHRTLVTPPLKKVGGWLIAASALPGFPTAKNQILGTSVTISNFTILHRRSENSGVEEALVVNASTGAPVAQAKVELWSHAWDQAGALVETAVSNTDGFVKFKPRNDDNREYFVVARIGDEFTMDPQDFNLWAQGTGGRDDTSVIYTDRSIYRPNQHVKWKVVAFRTGDDGPSKLLTNRPVKVELLDGNYQLVATLNVTTNAFGSASGDFLIPAGKMLGQWRLRCLDAEAYVRVEEYKRPTFELQFRESKTALKLNAKATFTAEAKYYFGLPVTVGKVTWNVKRQAMYPWWWGRWGGAAAAQMMASGTTTLKPDGSVDITFMPIADPLLSRDVTYSYSVHAELTDEGGETRTAERSFQLGQVSVRATVDLEKAFFRAGTPGKITIHRTDLNNAPRAGKGTWKLFALKQPTVPLLPDQEPVELAPNAPKPELTTPGDLQRLRWEESYDAQAVLRRWADGAAAGAGSLTHAATGDADVALPKLAAGAYRLRYETIDDFGSTCAIATEFLVADTRVPAQLPMLAMLESPTAHVGEKVTLLLGSAFADQLVLVEEFHAEKLRSRKWIIAGQADGVIERPIIEGDRGGFVLQVTVVRDWQVMRQELHVTVPRDDKALDLEFSTFRDSLRPGAHETFRIAVKGRDTTLTAGAAEVLAYMYDQSLDSFGAHQVPSLFNMFPSKDQGPSVSSPQRGTRSFGLVNQEWFTIANWIPPRSDGLVGAGRYWYGDAFDDDSRIGLGSFGTVGRGAGGGGLQQKRFNTIQVIRGSTGSEPPPPDTTVTGALMESEAAGDRAPAADARFWKANKVPAQQEGPAVPVRSNFSETAFFAPHLLIDDMGQAAVEFDVPDSTTSWNVLADAVTKDLRSGSVSRTTRSVKELMVRPYLPRFLREGDEGALKILVNNASAADFKGELTFDLIDPVTEQSVLGEFAVAKVGPQPFSAKAGGSATLTFPLKAPRRVGEVIVKVIAKAGANSDGEQRVLPLLPSRMHLAQSKFVTLKNADSRTMVLTDLAKNNDASRINEQLVVTVDAQLFYSVLTAIPYLQRYPYECAEQTMNRFVSTAIVGRVFKDNPAIAAMAKEMSARKAPLETFDSLDANRKLQLEESPWLQESKGNKDDPGEHINMLNPPLVEAERASALLRLQKMQSGNGGFPWFPGGPPSAYVTLTLLSGFARAAEFKVDLPRDMVQRAWTSVAPEFRKAKAQCEKNKGCDWQFLTFGNYLASSFPDDSWLAGALSSDERTAMLNLSFKNWKSHSSYLKAQLALTLKRAGRDADAKLVFDSVMDSAKTTEDEGTFWQPEDRAWLWYNDTIESHAFALRTLQELNAQDSRRAGLVQWLLLNKKLGHWKSTRATAEVIYSLVKFMQADKSLGIREESKVTIGPVEKTFVFEPGKYTGKKNQIVIPGKEVVPAMSSVTVSKSTKGYQFASVTWHYSTDLMPTEERGDFFSVKRSWFKRVTKGTQTTLQPLAEGALIQVGDELEVQLSLRAKQSAEYVHLRDPRGAGFEPEGGVSTYKYDLGIGWYEEYRDSATNFFFESLPAGEYTFKYRVRASMSGNFRVGPAELQSMYAPEFNAFSTGAVLHVKSAGE